MASSARESRRGALSFCLRSLRFVPSGRRRRRTLRPIDAGIKARGAQARPVPPENAVHLSDRALALSPKVGRPIDLSSRVGPRWSPEIKPCAINLLCSIARSMVCSSSLPPDEPLFGGSPTRERTANAWSIIRSRPRLCRPPWRPGTLRQEACFQHRKQRRWLGRSATGSRLWPSPRNPPNRQSLTYPPPTSGLTAPRSASLRSDRKSGPRRMAASGGGEAPGVGGR